MSRENNVFGSRLKHALSVLNVKQKELADKANLNEASVSKYIKGQAIPTAPIVARIASALNVSADYLLGLKNEVVPIHEAPDPWAEDIQIIKDSYTTLSWDERNAIIQLVRAMRRDKNGSRPR